MEKYEHVGKEIAKGVMCISERYTTDSIILLCHWKPRSEYVTWIFDPETGARYLGHYFGWDFEAAVKDFNTR